MKKPRRRHVWVQVPGVEQLQPGLVIAWRRTAEDRWEAQVATRSSSGLHVAWTSADTLRPLTDDQIVADGQE